MLSYADPTSFLAAEPAVIRDKSPLFSTGRAQQVLCHSVLSYGGRKGDRHYPVTYLGV